MKIEQGCIIAWVNDNVESYPLDYAGNENDETFKKLFNVIEQNSKSE